MKIKKIKLILFTLLLLIIAPVYATPQYELVVDTSGLQGTQALIAYDLIDGSPDSSIISVERAKIDGVFFGLGSTLEDLNFYNTFEQEVTLGNELALGFSLLSGEVPSLNFFPDSFSIFLLDLFGFPLVITSDPTGADSLVQWDVGLGDPIVFMGTLNMSDSNATNTVPEPPTIFLLFIGGFFILIQKKRRLVFLFISSFILTNSTLALSAPSLESSTDLTLQGELKASGLRLNRRTRTFDSVLTITNKSQSNLDKPFTVAVLSLPDGVILSNATEISDEDIPMITVDLGQPLTAGTSMNIILKFVNRSNQAFPLTFRFIRLDQPIPELTKLLGPDVDNNGVRDDLEPILDTRYTNDTEKSAAVQVLKAMRNGLGSTGSVETAFNAVVALNKSLDCLFSVYETNRGESESEFLRDQMMNSYDRIAAWIALTDKIAGQSIPVGTSNACETQ